MNLCPKIHLLYYKALIDKCFIRFFDDFNNSFTNINDQYVFSDDPGKTQLKKIFRTYLSDELKKYIKPYSILKPEYYIIIGDCYPKNNILLSAKLDTVPKKLLNLVNADYLIKYLLKEKDIKLDLIYFNTIFDDIFNELFKNQNKIYKLLSNKNYKNLFFITHNKLDSYSVYKIIKYLFGKNNCINIFKKYFSKDLIPLISINDLLNKYIHDKIKLSKTKEFNICINEIQQFLNEKILGVIDGNQR